MNSHSASEFHAGVLSSRSCFESKQGWNLDEGQQRPLGRQSAGNAAEHVWPWGAPLRSSAAIG
eukprot:scaffold58792_cov16-Tisochrysis_lutea.AAC.3